MPNLNERSVSRQKRTFSASIDKRKNTMLNLTPLLNKKLNYKNEIHNARSIVDEIKTPKLMI